MKNIQIETLKRLPKQPQITWQGGVISAAAIMGKPETGEEDDDPCGFMWVDVNQKKIGPPIAVETIDDLHAKALTLLVDFATEDQMGCCPGQVEVCDQALADFLSSRLKEIGIKVVQREELPFLDQVFGDLLGSLQEFDVVADTPGMLKGRGMTIDRTQRYAKAASAYFQAAPWQHLTNDDILEIKSPKPPMGMKYTVVMGNGQTIYGLGFYTSIKHYIQTLSYDIPLSGKAEKRKDIWTVIFGARTTLSIDDLKLWADHDLAVAAEHAYPCAACYKANDTITRPSAKTTAFLEGLLSALAQTTEQQLDLGQWTVEVETYDGPVTYTLALPDLINPPDAEEKMKRGRMPDLRSMEKMQASMQRFMESHPVDSMDEMNDLLAQQFNGRAENDDPSCKPRSPQEEAQDLCYDAFDAFGRRQYQLVQEALMLDPDCADAYVILAERQSHPIVARTLYEKGTEAGERTLGKKRFKEDAGHFWGMTDTRPYMRAKLGVANTLNALDKTPEAINHYHALLQLNPNDNQCVRHSLLPLLIKHQRYDETIQLIRDFKEEESTLWFYAKAFLAFHLGGDNSNARTLLRYAHEINPYVIEMLDDSDPNFPIPSHYSPGSPEEALICLSALKPIFQETPNAMEWFKSGGEGNSMEQITSPQKSTNRRRQPSKKRRKGKSR